MKIEFERELKKLQKQARQLIRNGKLNEAALVTKSVDDATEAINEMEQRLGQVEAACDNEHHSQ